MPRLDPAFQSLAELLGRTRSPPFRVMINIGLHLVAAFEALHGAGLCYRDINPKNLWVDVGKGEVAIIDNDNVGTDDAEVFVWGTSGFMAPEVVRREKFPTGHTDLHSLAAEVVAGAKPAVISDAGIAVISGVESIAEKGGGPGLRKRRQPIRDQLSTAFADFSDVHHMARAASIC